MSAAELGESYAQEPPLLAVKVILPYADTAEAISNSRRDPDRHGHHHRVPGDDRACT